MRISSVSSEGMIPVRTRGLDTLKSRLHPGEIVRTRVIGDLRGGKVAVRLRGHNLVAESQLSLPKGVEVLSSVTQLEPRIMLRVLGPAEGQGGLANILRGLGVSMTNENLEAATALRAHSVPLTRGHVLGVATATANVSSMMAASVRPDQIVRLLAFLQGRSDVMSLGAGTALFFGRTLEGGELENLASILRALRVDTLFEGSHLLFHIPPWREPEARGELRVYRDDARNGSSGKDQEVRMVLFLDMKRLGPMRVEVSVRGKEVRCEFQLTDEKGRERLDARLSDLDSGLSGLGYLVTYLACTIWRNTDHPVLTQAEAIDWFA